MSSMADLTSLKKTPNNNRWEKKRLKKEKFLSMVRDKRRKCYGSSVSSDDEGDEYFIWEKYLERQHAKPVPKTAFKHVKDTKKSGFKSGMKVEAKDQTNSIDSYWVATIVMVSGPLLLLRFDGYDDDRSGDFWLDSSSELLQPIGWCAKTDNLLIPPEAIKNKNSNWAKFLVENLQDAIAAPDDLFHKVTNDESESDDQLKVGSKVELQDDIDPLYYWPAVIIEKYGLRLRLRYFCYEEEDKDVWEDYLSHRVHNLGWGRKMGLMLCPPEVMDRYFQWKTYKQFVKLCKSPGSRQMIKEIPKITGIEPGMKLELVNPLDPSTMCVASIKEILNDYFFTVGIDRIAPHTDDQSHHFVYHAQSRYLYPVGWCKKNNVILKPPGGFSPNSTSFDWSDYLDQTLSEAAPDSLFRKDLVKFKVKPEFNIGHKVEVLDREDSSCYWIATVTNCSIKYTLCYCPSTVEFPVYRYTDAVHALGWGKTMGLRFKPPKDLKGYEKQAELLRNICDAEDQSTNTMYKLDKEDNLPPRHGFIPGMQLEAVNPQDPSSICVASVIERNGEQYFTLQIDDFIEQNNQKKLRFWCHSNSKNIFPVGWCKKNNVQLTPPPGHPYKEFIWEEYMKSKYTTAAPESLFCQVSPCSEFEVGCKLEAVDQTNPQTISVSTVNQVVGGTVWIRLDGYQSNAVEQIYDVESHKLFPVGWSSMHGHPLLAPKLRTAKNEVEPKKWSTLLRKRTTPIVADSSTNKRRKTTTQHSNGKTPNNSEKPSKSKDFSISVVVKSAENRSPSTSGVATPTSSTGDDSTRQEVCDDTDTADEDGDPQPKTTKTTIDLTDDYNRVGDKELLLYIKKTCSCGPYLNKNSLSSLPDTIGPASPNIVLKQVVERVVICSTSRQKVLNILSSEKEKQSFLSILKTLTTKLEICENLFSLNKVNACSRCDKDIIISTSPTKPTLAKPSSTTNSIPNIINPTTTRLTPLNSPLSQPSTSKTFLSSPNGSMAYDEDDDVHGKVPDGHISTWSIDDVIQFVTPRGCKKFASIFQEQEVDGKALMLLSLDDIHKVLGVTLGPAIKLHDDTQKLRYKKH